MDVEDRCALIEEFVREYSKYEFAFHNEDFLDFKLYNDLGIPLAQSVTYGLVNLTEEGMKLVDETWVYFCDMLESDPDGEYESIYDMGNLDNND